MHFSPQIYTSSLPYMCAHAKKKEQICLFRICETQETRAPSGYFGRPKWLALFLSFILPFILSFSPITKVGYLYKTHTLILFYDSKACTTHLAQHTTMTSQWFFFPIQKVLNNIVKHHFLT